MELIRVTHVVVIRGLAAVEAGNFADASLTAKTYVAAHPEDEGRVSVMRIENYNAMRARKAAKVEASPQLGMDFGIPA